MKRSRLLLAVAGLALALAAVGSSTAGAGVEGVQADDPCRTRPATELDRLPEWRCVGLARYHEKDAEPDADELVLDDERAKRAAADGPDDEWGVAVSPDGRMYVHRLSPFSVLGSDQRQLRLATTSYPWRALVAILAPGATTSGCSGTLVGPRHVLTAGHCLFKNGAWFPNRKVAPGMSGIGNFPNGLKNHSWYYISKGWLEDEDPENDFGMLILQDLSSTANLGWFGTQVSNGASAWNFGYPGWWRTCAASPSPPQCSNFLYGMSGYATKVGDWFFSYTIDTQPGQSGSPVYKYNGGDRRVIGVHAYGAGSGSVNWAKRLRPTTIDTICSWINTWPSAYRADTCV